MSRSSATPSPHRPARRAANAVAFLLAVLAIRGTAFAVGDEDSFHVIRPGDTLRGLAARYLGDAERWPVLHELNPELITDPHWIYPGRRIRVRVSPDASQPHAEVVALARQVETQPTPVRWRSAERGDLLIERDGLRTFEQASARLVFEDGTSATLSENSLVYIRRQTASPTAAPRKEIEIEVGQADLGRSAGARGPAPEIEVIVAAARVRAMAEADGTLSSRSRKAGDAAQFMMYGGRGTVSASGQAVDLPAGTGSVVPPKAPPKPAEPLLPAPGIVDPPTGGELGRDDPSVRWSAVASAVGYVVELCADSECGQAIEHLAAGDVTHGAFVSSLPDGPAFLRVTAVAPSGLDGFPSPARPLTIVPAARPPAPVVTLLDAGANALFGGACTALPPTVGVRALDRRGQPLAWRLELDGQRVDKAALAGLAVGGRHSVVVEAVDDRGRATRAAPVPFELDLAAPRVDLPVATGQPPLPESDAPRPSRWRRTRRQDTPTVDPCHTGLELALGDSGWAPVACDTAASTDIALAGDRGEIRLRAAGGSLRLGEFLDLEHGDEVTLIATDEGCGLAGARLSLRPSPHRLARGRALLEVEVSDVTGRSTTSSWHVGRATR